MPDEVRALGEKLRDIARIAFEVDAPVRRRRAEAAAIDQQQPVTLGDGALLAPRFLTPAETAVDEDRRLAVPPDGDVDAGRGTHASDPPGGPGSRADVQVLVAFEQRRAPEKSG